MIAYHPVKIQIDRQNIFELESRNRIQAMAAILFFQMAPISKAT